MAAIYGQITLNDLVIARYTADAWRGRVYAVRYFLTFMVSGVAVSMIAVLYGRGGFGLVLGATAFIALGFLVAVLLIAFIANGVERERDPDDPAGGMKCRPVTPRCEPSAMKDHECVSSCTASRAASAMPIIAVPPNSMLMPTSKPERPGRGPRQAGENNAGKDEVDDAARQHPAPAARTAAPMLDGVHDRGDALDHEEGDQDQRQR